MSIVPSFTVHPRESYGILDLKGSNLNVHNKDNILERIINSLSIRKESLHSEQPLERPRAIFLAISTIGTFKSRYKPDGAKSREDNFYEILDELNHYGETLVAEPQKNSGTAEQTEVIPALFLPKYDLIEEQHDISNYVNENFVKIVRFRNDVSRTHCCACPIIKIGNLKDAVDFTTIQQYVLRKDTIIVGNEKVVGKPFRVIISNSASKMNKYKNLLEEKEFGEMEYTTDSSGEILYGLVSYNRPNILKHYKQSQEYTDTKSAALQWEF